MMPMPLPAGFEERHTAVNIANYLKDATEKWLLSSEKVIACVHDNAANMVLANQSLWESVPCFAHTLQLAINEGFNVAIVKNVIAASSRLVSHFPYSTVATAALRQKQQEQNMPKHKLIQHCLTRWNSVCDMFERLLEQRWAVCAVLSDRNVTKLADAGTLDLKDEHWEIVEELAPVLKSLKCATTAMCSETHVSISMVYPITHSLIARHPNTQRGESTRVSELKNAVAESLKRRIVAEDAEKVYLPLIAAALDPRHKHLKFFETELQERVKRI
ncbi:putative zinc finger BED domain-containing protein 1-like [Triplophysa rosa]|uniref:Zinc finger BED domain-containing protein 1-like n=1 Tax=Triplophysa rosa TaxID=992332 RepID=A0A9W7T4F0_TRIRA|nr:putative zinc finger BED domain-containing protein 1-like [Triplophysa rosa]